MAEDRQAKQAAPNPHPGTGDPGGDGLGRDQVARFQRARMLSAMVAEVSERGAGNVSVAHVVARSGVSRRTFYEIFEDREDCFLAAFDDALKGVLAVVVPAFERSGSWRVRMRAALSALLESLEGDPATGRLLIVESLVAGRRAFERRQNLLAQLIPIIEQGRTESKAGSDPPPLTAEGIVGAVASVIYARLLADPPPSTRRGPGTEDLEGDSLLALTGPLMAMIVLPYLGATAARSELAKPVPSNVVRPVLAPADPLRDIEMRLTYRTLRVLIGLGEIPGASNRQIGESAGIGDQGQVSKLLRRLNHLGLVQNTLDGQGRGAPNAWVLTRKGRELARSVQEGAGG
jgi:AcrR family transcriptional regulator/DNA-binding MarR family transcriptional regulator